MQIYKIFIVSLVLMSCSYFEYESNSYLSYEELSASSEEKLTWLPKNIPRSATSIQEAHYVDKPESLGKYSVKAADLIGIFDVCPSTAFQNLSLHLDGNAIDWLANTNSSDYYLCDGNTFITVFDGGFSAVVYFVYRPYG